MLIFLGELNDIASLISTIYLAAYALLNLCTFHVAYFKPLGWRPSYKVRLWYYYNFIGVIVCVYIITKYGCIIKYYFFLYYMFYSSITNG